MAFTNSFSSARALEKAYRFDPRSDPEMDRIARQFEAQTHRGRPPEHNASGDVVHPRTPHSSALSPGMQQYLSTHAELQWRKKRWGERLADVVRSFRDGVPASSYSRYKLESRDRRMRPQHRFTPMNPPASPSIDYVPGKGGPGGSGSPGRPPDYTPSTARATAGVSGMAGGTGDGNDISGKAPAAQPSIHRKNRGIGDPAKADARLAQMAGRYASAPEPGVDHAPSTQITPSEQPAAVAELPSEPERQKLSALSDVEATPAGQPFRGARGTAATPSATSAMGVGSDGTPRPLAQNGTPIGGQKTRELAGATKISRQGPVGGSKQAVQDVTPASAKPASPSAADSRQTGGGVQPWHMPGAPRRYIGPFRMQENHDRRARIYDNPADNKAGKPLPPDLAQHYGPVDTFNYNAFMAKPPTPPVVEAPKAPTAPQVVAPAAPKPPSVRRATAKPAADAAEPYQIGFDESITGGHSKAGPVRRSLSTRMPASFSAAVRTNGGRNAPGIRSR